MHYSVWIGFIVLILALVALDLGFLRRRVATRPAFGFALRQSAWWVSLGLAFAGFIRYGYNAHFWGLGMTSNLKGTEAMYQYLSGYFIEQALSVDNLFVIAVILTYFRIPEKYQYKVLLWGILGVLLLRGLMITAGVALLHYFSWMNYVFGAILLYTAYKMWSNDSEEEMDFDNSPIPKLIGKFVPLTSKYGDGAFIVRLNGKKFATPLLIALVVIELTDVLFAFDSVPAVFSLTKEPFIVFSSNVFAILGLRALYFVLIESMQKFIYLEKSVIIVLIYIGLKMMAEEFIQLPILLSLIVVAGLLTAGVLASLWFPKKETAAEVPVEKAAKPKAVQ